MPPIDPKTHHERQARALRHRLTPAKEPKKPARPQGREPAPPPVGTAEPAPPEEKVPAPEVIADAVTASEAVVPPPARKRRVRVLGHVLRVLVILGLAALLVQLTRTLQLSRSGLEARTDEAMREVRYVVPGQDDIVETVLYGDTASLHRPVSPRGLTFLGWENEDGMLETQTSFPVYGNRVFRGRYALHFETGAHIPYLSTDEDGIVHAESPVTRREFVCVLHTLLNTDLKGKGAFLDVPEDDECHDAAAVLKDLGVLTGSQLHPDTDLTRGEMIRMLCSFFPAAENTDAVFQDLEEEDELYPFYCTAVANGWLPDGVLVRANPTAVVCRGELARVMNRVLGRGTGNHPERSQVGTLLDVPPGSQWYDDLAEAVIPHRYRKDKKTDVEKWVSSEPLPLREPGYFFSGVRLHYINEDYTPAVNGRYHGLDFNRNGEITCGDEDLDRALIAILEETIDPATMTREEMLRAVYDYVVHSFNYAYGNMYERGAQGWEIREAKRMLRNGAGNCYCFASLFYELARFVGYDARIYAGWAYGEQYDYYDDDQARVVAPQGYTPHGWVEIEMDGKDELFDPEYEYRSAGLMQMFKAEHWIYLAYGYTK